MNGRHTTKIVESAANCFLVKGFSETSLDDICTHSGVVKQTLYNNFDNKESLFKASMSFLIQRTSLQPEQSWLALQPAQFLEKIGKLQLKTLQERGTTDFLRLIVKECRRFPDLQRTYAQHVPKPVIDFVCQYLASSPHVSKDIRQAGPEFHSAIAWCFRAGVVGYATLSNLGPLIDSPLPTKSSYLALLSRKFACFVGASAVCPPADTRSAKHGQQVRECIDALYELAPNKGSTADSEPIAAEQLFARAAALARPKRRAILMGALHAFPNQGFADTSMDLIASLADASKQTVYHHFRGKEELYLELFSEIMLGMQTVSCPINESSFLQDYARALLMPLDTPVLREYFRLVLGESASFPLQSGLLLRHLLDHQRQALKSHLLRTHTETDAEALSVVLRSILGTFALTRNIYVLDDDSYVTERGLVSVLDALVQP